MAGIENNIIYGGGFKLQPSQARDISDMQRTADDASFINYPGNPESNVSANPSSLCFNPTTGDLYKKGSGTGNTGWALVGGGGGGGITTVAGNSGSSTGPTVTFNGDTGGNPVAGKSVSFTFSGDTCQLNLTDAHNSTFLGSVSGFNSTTAAEQCTFVGANSGVNVTSSNHVGIGYQCLNSLTGNGSDGFNTVVGINGFFNLVDGAYNIGLGQNCGDDVGISARSNIMIASRGFSGDNNTMRLGTQGTGDSQIDSTFIAGIAQVTVSNAEMVVIDTTTGEMGSQAIPSASPCAFSAYLDTGVSNVTGDGTVYPIIFDTAIQDLGGDFDIGTGNFTAPTDDFYHFDLSLNFEGITAGHNNAFLYLLKSGANPNQILQGTENPLASAVSGNLGKQFQTTVYLTAGQTVTFNAIVQGGAKVVDISGSGGAGAQLLTYIAGYRVVS